MFAKAPTPTELPVKLHQTPNPDGTVLLICPARAVRASGLVLRALCTVFESALSKVDLGRYQAEITLSEDDDEVEAFLFAIVAFGSKYGLRDFARSTITVYVDANAECLAGPLAGHPSYSPWPASLIRLAHATHSTVLWSTVIPSEPWWPTLTQAEEMGMTAYRALVLVAMYDDEDVRIKYIDGELCVCRGDEVVRVQ